MTLIFSTLTLMFDVVGGDILASSETVSGDRSISLPSLPFLDRFSTNNGELTGTVQKICRINSDLLVLWAGSAIIARQCIAAIEKRQDDPVWVVQNLEQVLNEGELRESDVDNVELIVLSTASIPSKIVVVGGSQKRLMTSSVHCGGTGTWHFFDRSEMPMPRGTTSLAATVNEIALRIGRFLIAEVMEQDSLHHFYGGWIDLFLAVPVIGTTHMPYLIKVWQKLGGAILDNGPVLFSGRAGDDLTITRIDERLPEGERLVQFRIPDIRSRGGPVRTAEFKQVNAAIQLHILYDHDRPGASCALLAADTAGFRPKLVDDHYEIAIADDFRDFVDQAMMNEPSDFPEPYIRKLQAEERYEDGFAHSSWMAHVQEVNEAEK